MHDGTTLYEHWVRHKGAQGALHHFLPPCPVNPATH